MKFIFRELMIAAGFGYWLVLMFYPLFGLKLISDPLPVSIVFAGLTIGLAILLSKEAIK